MVVRRESRTTVLIKPFRHPGFLVSLTAVLVMMGAASVPSPFYPVIQERLGFSNGVLALIFAVYALTLLATLLVTGAISDHVGRRPIISAGLFGLSISMVALWQADSVGVLLGSRVFQGVAAGLLLSALSAAVVDFEPSTREGMAPVLNTVVPLAGLALGALVSGLTLDHVAGSPVAVLFGTLAALLATMGVAIWFVRETSLRVPGAIASLRPRLSVPEPARREFWRAVPAVVAGWALGGLYLSLGGPLAELRIGADTQVEQALVVSILTGSGAIACFLARSWTGRFTTLYGTVSLAVGTALTVVALAAGSFAGFTAAAVVAGTGFGTAFLGIMRSITPLVGPEQRGELFSAVFVASYLSFGIPAVIAGYASGRFGLAPTAYVYGAVVVLLASTAAFLRWRSTD